MSNFDRNSDYLMVAGPTASGKSALALDLARAYDGVVINADSMQIYKDLRIVTACPDDEEQGLAPHRLYNVLDGSIACSVGKWMSLVRQEVEGARAQDKLPILCGGTALYLNAAQHGISSIPDIPDELHDAVIAEHRDIGGEAMLAELANYDPDTALRLNARDSQRITRAVEVYRHTQRPLSLWQQDPQQGHLSGSAFNFFIAPDRAELYERIDRRFASMWEAGALAEVEDLLARHLDPKLPIMKAVGVPQIADYIQGRCTKHEAIAEAQKQSRRYAKRQFTFFRNNFVTNYLFEETYSKRKNLEFFSKILR